jgi:hypothetical protein
MKITAIKWGCSQVVAQWRGQAPVQGQVLRLDDTYYEIVASVYEVEYVLCDDPEVKVYVVPKMVHIGKNLYKPWKPE